MGSPNMAAPLAETKPAKTLCAFDSLFTDLTLRAGTDGATARVHRGIVGQHSHVFLDALTAPALTPEELPLPGKSAADLKLLTAFMYPRRSRDETFSVSNLANFCELGREYDMRELLIVVDDWLVAHGAELMPLAISTYKDVASKEKASQFLKLMLLAHEFELRRFFEFGLAWWALCTSNHNLLEACSSEARALPSEVMFRMLKSGSPSK